MKVEYVAPRDGVEHEIAGVWAELLGVEQVSVEDARAAGGTHDEELSLGTPALVRERDRELTNTLPGTIAGDDRPFDGAMRFSGQGRAWVGPCALDASQHRGDRLARGIGRRPAGQRLGGAVERDDPTAGVDDDDTVLDGAEDGLERGPVIHVLFLADVGNAGQATHRASSRSLTSLKVAYSSRS